MTHISWSTGFRDALIEDIDSRVGSDPITPDQTLRLWSYIGHLIRLDSATQALRELGGIGHPFADGHISDARLAVDALVNDGALDDLDDLLPACSTWYTRLTRVEFPGVRWAL